MKITKIMNQECISARKISESNLVLTLPDMVCIIDTKSPAVPTFISEKLSNMCGAFYDAASQRLLVYNTSGHAYLYSLTTCTRLLPKLYLRGHDLNSEEIVMNSDFCWYIDSDCNLRQCCLTNGKTKAVIKDAKKRVISIIRDGNYIYVFSTDRHSNEQANLSVARYLIEDEKLHFQASSEISQFSMIGMPRKDLNRKNIIMIAERKNPRIFHELVVFHPDTMTFSSLRIKETNRFGYVSNFHTALECNLVIFACHSGIQFFAADTGKVLEEHVMQFGSDITFLDSETAILATWHGIYHLDIKSIAELAKRDEYNVMWNRYKRIWNTKR